MFTTRPELSGTFGMVASTHWLASQCGAAVLEAGGNAFDAAVASGFVLQVVEPHLNGLFGEAPILAYVADGNEVSVVNGQGAAPQKATIEHFTGLGLDIVPGTGLLAAAVPGAFAAWLLLLQQRGTMRFSEVMKYAIHYAEGGFPVLPQITETIGAVERLFREHWPSSAEVYLANGIPAAGSRFANPVLARTLRRLVAEAEAAGPDRDNEIDAARSAFYEGFVAEEVVRYLETTEVMDSSGERHGGLLGHDELSRHRATVEKPLSYDYHGHTLFKPGPWTQGPVFLQQLALLEGFDLDGMATDSDEFAHVVIECAKLAFADREAYYGDPDFVDVPVEALLSREYNAQRRRLVTQSASDGLRPGSPGGRTPVLPVLPEWQVGGPGSGEPTARRTGAGVGEPTVARNGLTKGDTCHVDVVDRWGNMVSATPSGGWLQSSPVIPSLGACLGTRLQTFWLTEGLPNSLVPGKRPRTTLTPSMAFRGGRPYLAFGTPGGDQQDQWSLLVFLRHVHHGLNLQEAIDAPAWHTTHFPSSFYPRESYPREVHVESRASAATIEGLRRRGHDVIVDDPWSLGRVTAVSIGENGLLRAAANPRGMQGYAVGR